MLTSSCSGIHLGLTSSARSPRPAPRAPHPAPRLHVCRPSRLGAGAVRELFAFAPEYGPPLLARLPHGELLVLRLALPHCDNLLLQTLLQVYHALVLRRRAHLLVYHGLDK